MKIKTMLLSAAAVGVAATPIAAQAIEADRAAAPVEGEAELGGLGSASILVVLAALVAVAFIADEITDSDEFPTSP